MMVLAHHMLMLGLMTCHVSPEITSFAVQPLIADVAIHLVLARVGREMLVEDLFVHE
jgi:hypothetical protein